MEKTIEREGNDDRKHEATTSAADTSISYSGAIKTQLDIPTGKISCTGQEKCITEQVTCDFESRIIDYVETDGINQSPNSNNFKLAMLFQYSKEFLGFFALILTTYATLLNREHTIGTLSPKPIFPSDSIVQEWPYGQLIDVQSRVAISELSLIFFYAPWCAESLAAKNVFNTVATLYSKEAYFAAINCWQPGSSCRTNYSNVYKWPVIMAYLPNALPVQYNGPLSANSLVKFIDGVLMPVVRVHNHDELMKLRIANDIIVFGIFTSIDSKEYQVFFHAAIKWMESVLFQNAKFAVYTGLDASMFLETEPAPVIKLLTINETIIYNDEEWVSKNILKFVRPHVMKTSIWLNLSNSKSSIIRTYLQKGPVLLMFSPRTSLNLHYFIMRQVIYLHKDYQHDLNNSVLNNYINHVQKEYSAKLKIAPRYCEFLRNLKYKDIQTEFFNSASRNSLLTVNAQLVNTSRHTHAKGNECNCDYCDDDIFERPVRYGTAGSGRSFVKVDDRSPEGLLRKHLQKECLHLERLPPISFRESTIASVDSPGSLLEYFPHNRTLTFLMLDSVDHGDYIHHFIGDNGSLKDTPSSSAAFIIDTEEEALYKQKGPISTMNTIEFVRSFYSGKLRRHMRSFARATVDIPRTSPTVSIKEINSRQFAKTVRFSNATSVVLFYSPRCLLCSIMSQTLLHVSHIMNLNNVNFYRIDGSANDFSWEYAMDKYPTLIVFLQNRSMDTSVFPSSLEINVKNVFGFILSKLKPEQQLKSLANACMLTKLSHAFQDCVRHLREMVSNEINRYLHQWNRSTDTRTLILKRLQMLKEVYTRLLQARRASDIEFIPDDILMYENGNYSYTV